MKTLVFVIDMLNGFVKFGAMADPSIAKIAPAVLKQIEAAKNVHFICGIGFTMALFVDGLAYGGSDMYHYTDKLAVFLGSIISGVVGFFVAKAVSVKQS